MIEEQGRVVAVEPGAVWVETLRKSTCSSCSAKAGCGQGLADTLGVKSRRGHVRAVSHLHLHVGDAVVIGVHETLLVRSSLLVYFLPLLALFAAALTADHFSLGEPLVIACSFMGLFTAWFGVRWFSARHANDPALQPMVVRALLAGTAAF